MHDKMNYMCGVYVSFFLLARRFGRGVLSLSLLSFWPPRQFPLTGARQKEFTTRSACAFR